MRATRRKTASSTRSKKRKRGNPSTRDARKLCGHDGRSSNAKHKQPAQRGGNGLPPAHLRNETKELIWIHELDKYTKCTPEKQSNHSRPDCLVSRLTSCRWLAKRTAYVRNAKELARANAACFLNASNPVSASSRVLNARADLPRIEDANRESGCEGDNRG